MCQELQLSHFSSWSALSLCAKRETLLKVQFQLRLGKTFLHFYLARLFFCEVFFFFLHSPSFFAAFTGERNKNSTEQLSFCKLCLLCYIRANWNEKVKKKHLSKVKKFDYKTKGKILGMQNGKSFSFSNVTVQCALCSVWSFNELDSCLVARQ